MKTLDQRPSFAVVACIVGIFKGEDLETIFCDHKVVCFGSFPYNFISSTQNIDAQEEQ